MYLYILIFLFWGWFIVACVLWAVWFVFYVACALLVVLASRRYVLCTLSIYLFVFFFVDSLRLSRFFILLLLRHSSIYWCVFLFVVCGFWCCVVQSFCTSCYVLCFLYCLFCCYVCLFLFFLLSLFLVFFFAVSCLSFLVDVLFFGFVFC